MPATFSEQEKAELFGRLNRAETNLAVAIEQLRAHVTACNDATDEAKKDRKSFRKEMRAYGVAIIVALIGMAVGLRGGFL